MKNLLPWVVCIFLIFGSQLLHSQPDDLRKDLDFFNKQAQSYQKWLESSGLGTTLHFYKVDVQAKKLSLYLAFSYKDIDSIMASWTLVKSTWETGQPTTLEKSLFDQALHLMEVPQSSLSVQIYDTYATRKPTFFLRGIYFDSDSGRVVVKANNPKSNSLKIQLSPPQFKMENPSVYFEIHKRLSKEEVFKEVIAFARARFERTECEYRYPKLELLETSDRLKFVVEDLCREVLTHEANPALATFLQQFGFDVNWVKRELLEFTILYEATSTGFKVTITIQGKFGSGIYAQLKRGAYMNMDPDFKEYLEHYTNTFKELLKQELQ